EVVCCVDPWPESAIDQDRVLALLSPTRVLSRLPALRIGIIDHETAIIEHFSLACGRDSTVLLACWLVFPLFLSFRSTPRRVDARSIPVIGCGASMIVQQPHHT